MEDENRAASQLAEELRLLRQQLASRAEDDMLYANLFEDMPLSLWEEDLSGVKPIIDALRERGVQDFPTYFDAHPDVLQQCVDQIKILNVNQTVLDKHGAWDKEEFLTAWNKKADPAILEMLKHQVIFVTQPSSRMYDLNASWKTPPVKMYVMPKFLVSSSDLDATWSKVILAIIDMTAQVEAQQALAERDAQLQLIFDYAYDGVSLHEEFPGVTERRLIGCNDRYAEMAGRSKEELLSIGNTMLVQKEVESGVDSRVHLLTDHDREAYQGLFSWIRPDGKENVIEYTAGRIIMDGRIMVVGLDRDITERLQTQKMLKMYSEYLETMVVERAGELRAQYRQLDAILSSTVDGIVVTDAAGHIVRVNRVAEAWLTETLYPKDAQELEKTITRLAQQAIVEKNRVAAEILELPGLDLELNAAPVESDDTDCYTTAVVNIHDISHLKVMERMKTSFVANVSHELRTPITTIKLCAHLIEQQPDQLDKYLPLLVAAADQQAQLAQDIVVLSRLDAGRIDLQRRPALLNELVESSFGHYRSRARQQDISLRFEPLESDILLYVDPNHVEQLFSRLLENALAYTPKGGAITVKARREAIAQRTGVVVTVTDTGIGIPEAEKPLIFERFFRGEKSSTHQASGTGLGLAIVKAVVELHGGQVSVESVEGIGSTFTVWLPAYNLTEEQGMLGDTQMEG
ncbi:MAG: PAS domain S-box protein [Anaerolineae bacterium]|nr:PAS domain S-box protein [Anaerolineae bacterium]